MRVNQTLILFLAKTTFTVYIRNVKNYFVNMSATMPFIPQRLTQARKMSGLSLRALSEKLGNTPSHTILANMKKELQRPILKCWLVWLIYWKYLLTFSTAPPPCLWTVFIFASAPSCPNPLVKRLKNEQRTILPDSWRLKTLRTIRFSLIPGYRRQRSMKRNRLHTNYATCGTWEKIP